MVAREGIFVMSRWNVFLCVYISVSKHSMVGLYGILRWMHMVSKCVLLKVNLYCENKT